MKYLKMIFNEPNELEYRQNMAKKIQILEKISKEIEFDSAVLKKNKQIKRLPLFLVLIR